MKVPRIVASLPHVPAAAGVVSIIGLAFMLGSSGCAEPRLETGYRYRPLNSSSLERRAFYADPYSMEAMEAERRQDTPTPVPGGRAVP